MKRIIIFIVIAVVLIVTAVLLVRIAPPSRADRGTPPVTDPALPSTEGGEWLGIYFQGNKVGYSSTKLSQTAGGYRFESVMKMSMVVANELRDIKMVAQVNTDADYRIADYYMNMSTFGHDLVATGKVSGRKVDITVTSQGITRTQQLELDSAPYFHDAIDILIKKKDLGPGDSLTLPFFDIATQTPSTVRIKMLGEDRLVLDGQAWTTQKVSVLVLGLESTVWLDTAGRFLKESSPLGIDMIREDRTRAVAAVNPDELVDILTFVSVRLDTIIPDPQAVTYMKLQIEGLDTVDLDIRSDFQRVITPRPLVIECIRPDWAAIEAPASFGPALQAYLEPSMYIQTEAPEIRSVARKIAGTEQDKKILVERLTRWVYGNLEKRPTVSMPSAIDVLKTMEGDCNEHSILFAALARALGIPTKIYVGLVNLGNAYYYHAWCCVYLGEWIPVDPTFNEFPANAGHLKLKEGELSEQTKVLKVVGRIGIKVLAYR